MHNKNYDKIFVEIFDSIFEIIIINFSNYPNFRPISNKVFSVFYWKKKGTNGMLAKFFLISEFELFRKKVMSSIFVENDHWQHHLVRARDPNFWNVLKCNFQNWKIDPILKKKSTCVSSKLFSNLNLKLNKSIESGHLIGRMIPSFYSRVMKSKKRSSRSISRSNGVISDITCPFRD